MENLLNDLYKSVQGRKRPEDVAEICRQLLEDQLSITQKLKINVAARGAHKRGGYGWSSMSDEFASVVGIGEQLESAARIFPTVPVINENEANDIEAVSVYLTRLNEAIGKNLNQRDFQGHRLSHEARKTAGLELSRRGYNRAFRYLAHLEDRLEIMRREARKADYARVAKTKLITFLDKEEILEDTKTACFIAYYAARCNLRSVFTNGRQVRPFDSICEVLFEFCRESKSTNWWAIAHIYPDAEVIAHLDDRHKGELLGKYAALLTEISELLREVWETSNINLEAMIVRRGNDSTTWNNTAGAWNKAREGWFALIDGLGMDEILESFCPGKVLRLMAADVAYWHKNTGGKLHSDTDVWAELPRPWDVLNGTAFCGRKQVEEACFRHKVDPEKSGWTKARPTRKFVEVFTPTPELVHGVEVDHPILAKILREAGVFSGKPNKVTAEKSHLN